jgi:Spy/CpxP family protein refolding chaperone
MNHFTIFLSAAALLVSAAASLAETASPYADQRQRSIKALSDQEISDLTEGRGLGMAKAAELNSYPGPLHVLEFATVLNLADTQRAATQSLYARMRERAQPLGIRIIEAERELDRAFVDGTISTTELRSRLTAIAALQGELRAVHLETHLAQRSVLTPQQVAKYDALRGYHANVTEPSGHQRKEH